MNDALAGMRGGYGYAVQESSGFCPTTATSSDYAFSRNLADTAKRDTYKYRYKKRNNVLHSGITDDLERREKEDQRTWSGGHIVQVGHRTTKDAAEVWERKQKKA